MIFLPLSLNHKTQMNFRILLSAFALFSSTTAFAQLPTIQADIPPPTLSARAYVLYDASSGQVLASQALNDRFEPASLTKIMTAYLVFDALRTKKLTLAQTVTVSERAWKAEGSRMFIDPKQSPSRDAHSRHDRTKRQRRLHRARRGGGGL
jgi:D-alanyl-D-alanine carboxypeptidase (penicillin-binding protein 5/6)